MSSYDQVVERWIAIALGRSNTTRQLRNPRMPVDGDHIFSYGRHFEIGRLIREEKGQPSQWLLNGDVWGVTTSGHQNLVRNAVQRTPLPVVIIPHRALAAAGIDQDSVRILEVTPDRNETIYHEHYSLPPRAVLDWEEITASVELTCEEMQAKVDKINAKALRAHTDRVGYAYDEMAKGKPDYWVRNSFFKHPPKPRTLDEHLADLSGYSKHQFGHEWRAIGHKLVCRTAPGSHRTWDMEYMPDGRTHYTRETTRHWLGESLIAATVVYDAPRRCKHCRGTGRAEGPVPATWVAPEPITRYVQGPITDPITGEVISRWGMYVETGEITPGYWKEQHFDLPLCTACRGRGRWTVERRRTTKFLSGFDTNETRPSYFFCELPPKSNAETVDEAYEALKPDTVKLAEQMGREVHRQGDIFAIPLASATKARLRKAGARFEKRGQLFGTNHVATETAYLPDGTTVVRGVLHHVPEFRRPDHKRVKLADGKTWHIVQKNLVPLAA